MLFYKPEQYLLPNFANSPGSTQKSLKMTYDQIRPDKDPVRGAAGDPYKVPIKYSEMMK